MRRFVYGQPGRIGEIDFNMTPLIDVAFQLIIFFILASRIASGALTELELARPVASQAIPAAEIETPNRVIVNVVLSDQAEKNPAWTGRAKGYVISGEQIGREAYPRLVELFKKRRQQGNPQEFYVEIRADQRVNFGDIEPVMRAATEAGIVRMNLTALTATGE